MSDKTKIEWADATWTPLRARRKDTGKVGVHCVKVSEECKNCYSETFNKRNLPNQGTGLAFTVLNTEKVEMFLDENMLLQPLRWKRPRTIFVNSQTDTFGEFVPDEMIDRLFAVMALCPQHRFLVLTKRALRMREYMTKLRLDKGALDSRSEITMMFGRPARFFPRAFKSLPLNNDASMLWPLPNVWLGVTAGTQNSADERIPDLLATPAVKRFVSAEPLLESIDLRNIAQGMSDVTMQCVEARVRRGEIVTPESYANYPPAMSIDSLTGGNPAGVDLPGIDWVIVGGESGPGARPMQIKWAWDLAKQCRDAGTAYFLKQLGAKPVIQACRQHHYDWGSGIGRKARFSYLDERSSPDLWRIHLSDRKGGDWDEWAKHLRVREVPAGGRSAGVGAGGFARGGVE